ncbi:MAG TPA: N-acetylmuramoyl-L-alanine amidase [Desulfosalsimonadaceae bacterium]|nr:N-acetylmuramoyl-L-alanine amidase [Desulfosalsimonadaceae bacterium]
MMRGTRSQIKRYLICGLIIMAWLGLTPGWGEVSEAPEASKKPVIIIDPGHGGHDHGAEGPGGSLEKDAALSFANILKETLQPAYRVKLTRTGDYGVSLQKRASMANHQDGALFISIHSGGFFRAGLDRWTVYGFNPDAGRSGSPMSAGNDSGSAGRSQNWRKIQTKYTRASQSLAETVTDHLKNCPSIGRVQSAEAPLLLLEGINMPAVIVEAGYLTNPSCESRLNDPDFLASAAQCLCHGIDAFFREK